MQLKDATLLLVDDEPDLLDIMAEWFRREGCRVLTAENGREALNLIQQHRVDAVISDIRMPVMDGVTLLRSLRSAHASRPSVIFISGFSDIEPREAYDLGIEAMMQKPIERKALVAAVARILTDREDLWSLPPAEQGQATLLASFDGLEAALSQGQLAFGRGGFCIHSTLGLAEGPVKLQLNFSADHRLVTGQGRVRWVVPTEALVGVEISFIDDNNREWILSLTEPSGLGAFIPHSTAAGSTAAVRR